MDLDDERGSHGGEQTSLYARTAYISTCEEHKKPTNINVVFRSSSYFLMKSRSYSSASSRYLS